MSKMMKKFVSLLVVGMVVMGGSAIAVATDTSDFTVYANNDLTMRGTSLIDGNAVVKHRVNVKDSNIWGELLYPSGFQGNHQDYDGQYTGPEPNYPIEFKSFPQLDKKEDLITSWPNTTIDQSGWYKKLDVTSGGLIINTNGKLIEIRADELIVKAPVTIIGEGKVVFYVDTFKCESWQGINLDGDPQNVMVYLSGNKKCNISGYGNVNIYSAGKGTIEINGGNHFVGNIYTNGNIKLSGGCTIQGFVYTPTANVDISGNAKILGKLVANDVNLTGGGKVLEGEVYSLTDGIVKDIIAKKTFHVVTSASQGGTITPYNKDVEEGTVIHVEAKPEEGYQLVRYEGGQPDGNGNITVTADMDLKAIFEAVETPQPDTDYVNGLLGEYFDSHETINDTAIRLKRIDPEIAFNFGYAAPEGTENQIGNENFAEKWTGFIKVPKTGDYTFKAFSDDGVRLTINGQKLIDRWGLVNLDYTISEKIHLEAGQFYPITLEHQQMPLYAAVYLFWEAEGVPMGIVPPDAFYVEKKVYDDFKTPVLVNQLSRTGTGLEQKFYSGAEGLGEDVSPVCEELGAVNYEWGAGSPNEDAIEDAFSARMTGFLEGKFTEKMILEFIVDDGIRVWVDDKSIIDSWKPNSDAMIEGTFDMTVGQKHKLKIEYNDVGGGATCIMRWKSDSQQLQVIPIEYLYFNSKI